MKTLLVLLVLSLSFMVASADEYTIVRQGNVSTIYVVTKGYNNEKEYVVSYNLTDPTVSQLTNIGLPAYLWNTLKAGDGITDTRLIEANGQLEAANMQLFDDGEYIKELGRGRILWRIATAIFGISFAITAASLISIKNSTKQSKVQLSHG